MTYFAGCVLVFWYFFRVVIRFEVWLFCLNYVVLVDVFVLITLMLSCAVLVCIMCGVVTSAPFVLFECLLVI